MDIILKYFPNLTETQITQFKALYPLYEEWNNKINVISRKDFDALYERHVLHSLAIAKYMPFKPGSAVIDLGTGVAFQVFRWRFCFQRYNLRLWTALEKRY
jgi:16S rRNA (guanine527-N7)-methyltransferase